METPFAGHDAAHLVGEIRVGETVADLVARARPVEPVPFVVMAITAGEAEPVLERDWSTRRVAGGEGYALLVLPAGGGGRGFGRLAAMLALTIAASAIAGPAGTAAAASAQSATVGHLVTAAITGAITLTGSAVINALLPPTLPGQDQAIDIRPSPTYSGGNNVARLGETIPRQRGRHRIVPDLAAAPWTFFRGRDLVVNQLLALGGDPVTVEEIQISDTAIWRASGGFTGAIDGIDIQIVQPGNAVTLFPTAVHTSPAVSNATVPHGAGGSIFSVALGTDPGAWIGPFPAVPAGETSSELAVDISWPEGIVQLKASSGSPSLIDVRVEIEARQINDLGAAVGGWQQLQDKTYTNGSPSPVTVTETFSVAAARWEVRMRRIGGQQDDTRRRTKTVWTALRSFLAHGTTYAGPVLALRLTVTDQLGSAASNSVRVIQTAQIPIRAADTWTAPVATRNPVWAALAIARELGRPDDRIDLAAWEAEAAIADARGDRFDGVFDRPRSAWEAMREILAVTRCQPVIVGDLLTLRRDAWQPLARMAMTRERIRPGTLSTRYLMPGTERADHVIVEYVSEVSWTLDEVACIPPGSSAEKPLTIRKFGITGRDHAWREGMHEEAVARLRGVIREWETPAGQVLARGDHVRLAVDLVDGEASGWIVDWDAGGLTMRLSQPITFAAGEDHAIALARPDGREWGPCAVTAADPAVLDAEGRHLAVTLDGTAHAALAAGSQGSADGIIMTELEEGPGAATPWMIGRISTRDEHVVVVDAAPLENGVVRITGQRDTPAVHLAGEGSAPADTRPTPTTIPEAPVVEAFDAVQRTAAGSPIVDISIRPALGAELYLVRVRYLDDATWQRVHLGPATEISVPVLVETMTIEVRAIGRLRGPPLTKTLDVIDTASPPAPVTDLALTGTWSGDGLAADWTAAVGADGYQVRLRRESTPGSDIYDVTALDGLTTATDVAIDATTIADAGARVRRLQLAVAARSPAGEAAEVTLELEDAAPEAPVVGTPTTTATTITVPFTELDPEPADLVEYRLHVGTVSGFTPAAGNEADTGAASPLEATGLTAATTYYIRVTSADGLGEPLNYADEIEVMTDAA